MSEYTGDVLATEVCAGVKIPLPRGTLLFSLAFSTSPWVFAMKAMLPAAACVVDELRFMGVVLLPLRSCMVLRRFAGLASSMSSLE